MNEDMTKSMYVIDERDENIFSTEMAYKIPLYQRGYAWKAKQLTQLLEDIQDVKEGMNYYIGSLIVSRQENFYEVVDGQQRLTSLYLLLNCLGIDTRQNLKFACRDKANLTLINIRSLIDEEKNSKNNLLNREELDAGILEGIHVLGQQLEIMAKNDFGNDFNKLKAYFIERLRRVVLYRIELPPHTDLNRYFEIMNTRGEQLEQHDIVKASMMDCLTVEEGEIFSKIWDACRDMNGYVQMHLTTLYRRILFGQDWKKWSINKWQSLYDEVMKAKEETKNENNIASEGEQLEHAFLQCLEHNYGGLPNDKDEGNESRNTERKVYESIIDFPLFLLHVLKVYVMQKGLSIKLPSELDDKELISSFQKVIPRDEATKAVFSKEFILFLLKLRFLFDSFVIKREFKYTFEKPDSEWSLKKFTSYQSGKNKSGDCINSFSDDNLQRKLLMLQACLRVSFTTPKNMPWITFVLNYLAPKTAETVSETDVFLHELERYVRQKVRECIKEGQILYSGVATNKIVFQYLDYLLWEKDQLKYKDFIFEFRDSVEHFYPQNPSKGSFEKWDEVISIGENEFRLVDQFGNLALITSSLNSKLSNQDPAVKVTKLKDAIKSGSIKLRLMRDILENLTTQEHGIEQACIKWKESECRKHGEEMMQILRNACLKELNAL